jgi:hypothetical protein
MASTWKQAVWSQFGAALDMMENAIRACPAELWSDPTQPPHLPDDDVVGFWYLAYHTAFWLDHYLADDPRAFTPPPPFTTMEFDPEGALPEQPYTQDEVLAYLAHGRAKCKQVIAAMTEERAAAPTAHHRRGLTWMELLLYNMRHVQHHTAQMNLMLRRGTRSAPLWVSVARDGL